MSNMDPKQKQLVVILLAVVVLFVVFKFGFSPIMEKVDEVNSVNTELKAKVSELEDIQAHEKDYKKEIEAADKGIKSIAGRYPSVRTPEDNIVMVDDMEEDSEINVSNIAFNEAENIYTSSFTNADGENIIVSKNVVVLNYESSYQGLKDCMDYINEYKDYMNVDSFNAAYNQETGLLSGTLTINQYSAVGLGREYKEPVINGVTISKDNIFGTAK